MKMFQKQMTNKFPLKRGQTIYSNIDPFLTELDDYAEEFDEDYNSLFSDEEDFKQF